MPDESTQRMHLFIDESGVRGLGPKASDHFILGGVAIRESNMHHVAPLLERLRAASHRQPGQLMHWNQIRQHSARLHIAQEIGRQTWLRSVAVVVCKRQLPPTAMSPSQQYLFALRMILERASWLARDSGNITTSYTLAHIKGFKLADLRHYEEKLRQADTKISWDNLPNPGRITQPKECEELQLADLTVSALGNAFNVDEHGNTEDRYAREMASVIYRGPSGKSAPSSYGLKMHPWNENTKAAYPWVAAL